MFSIYDSKWGWYLRRVYIQRRQQKKKREAEQILAAIAKRDAWIMDATECLVRQFRR